MGHCIAWGGALALWAGSATGAVGAAAAPSARSTHDKVAALEGAAAPLPASDLGPGPGPAPAVALARALEAWWRAVPAPEADAPFGQLVARAALANLGRPYGDGMWGEPEEAAAGPGLGAAPDALTPAGHHPRRNAFNCVTFIEASLAVARCRWQARPDVACFAAAVEELRFRGGRRAGWESRLHYFEAWLADNQARGLVAPLTSDLGGQPTRADFFFMSRHLPLYPPMAEPRARLSIVAQERSLSQATHLFIGRDRLAAASEQLQAGDIVSIVGSKAGLMITHTGFVQRGEDGRARLLHASSAQGRVVLISDRLEDYVMRRPERRGLVAARPLPPPPPP